MSNFNTSCVFRNSGQAAAAAAELQALTQTPSLLQLQTRQLIKQREERVREPAETRANAAPLNQLNLTEVISFVLDMVEDDEF